MISIPFHTEEDKEKAIRGFCSSPGDIDLLGGKPPSYLAKVLHDMFLPVSGMVLFHLYPSWILTSQSPYLKEFPPQLSGILSLLGRSDHSPTGHLRAIRPPKSHLLFTTFLFPIFPSFGRTMGTGISTFLHLIAPPLPSEEAVRPHSDRIGPHSPYPQVSPLGMLLPHKGSLTCIYTREHDSENIRVGTSDTVNGRQLSAILPIDPKIPGLRERAHPFLDWFFQPFAAPSRNIPDPDALVNSRFLYLEKGFPVHFHVSSQGSICLAGYEPAVDRPPFPLSMEERDEDPFLAPFLKPFHAMTKDQHVFMATRAMLNRPSSGHYYVHVAHEACMSNMDGIGILRHHQAPGHLGILWETDPKPFRDFTPLVPGVHDMVLSWDEEDSETQGNFIRARFPLHTSMVNAAVHDDPGTLLFHRSHDGIPSLFFRQNPLSFRYSIRRRIDDLVGGRACIPRRWEAWDARLSLYRMMWELLMEETHPILFSIYGATWIVRGSAQIELLREAALDSERILDLPTHKYMSPPELLGIEAMLLQSMHQTRLSTHEGSPWPRTRTSPAVPERTDLLPLKMLLHSPWLESAKHVRDLKKIQKMDHWLTDQILPQEPPSDDPSSMRFPLRDAIGVPVIRTPRSLGTPTISDAINALAAVKEWYSRNRNSLFLVSNRPRPTPKREKYLCNFKTLNVHIP